MDAFWIEYEPLEGAPLCFFGDSLEEAAEEAAKWDPDWESDSTVWAWNGEFYQRHEA